MKYKCIKSFTQSVFEDDGEVEVGVGTVWSVSDMKPPYPNLKESTMILECPMENYPEFAATIEVNEQMLEMYFEIVGEE